MQTNKDMTVLSQLPLELLSPVIFNMTVADTLNFKNAYENKDGFEELVRECDHRLSVKKYLDDNLGNGLEWLQAMSKCFCYISGSRSLDFFVPGSVTDSSDWDIYVSGRENTWSFMKYAELLGVTWRDEAQLVDEVLEKGEGKVVLSSDVYGKMLRTGKLRHVLTEKGYILPYGLPLTLPQNAVMFSVKDRVIDIENVNEERLYRSRTIYEVVQGQLLRNGKTIPLQLIRESREGGLLSPSSIFQFHSSCVQSFLGPHSAHHLYGKMAAGKESHYWTSCTKKEVSLSDVKKSLMTSPKVGHLAPEWKKYEDRGFSYKHLEPWTYGSLEHIRHIGDDECVSVYYPDVAGAPEAVSTMYCRYVKSMRWSEYGKWNTGICNNTNHLYLCDAVKKLEWFWRRDLYKPSKDVSSFLVTEHTR